MEGYQSEFIELAREREALRFGEFTLKSGRVSPYFFNAGLFHSGGALARLGGFYAEAVVHAQFDFDLLFGPAYKGIPLATATAIALSQHHGRDVEWCFNRKELKDHGEGGVTVGAPPTGRVLLIDDVITAGTAIRESMELLERCGATPAGIVISLDRKERGRGPLSAIQELERDYGIRIASIVDIDDLIAYLREAAETPQELAALREYRTRYGVD